MTARDVHKFLATIYKIWMLRYVDVPKGVGRALQKEFARRGSAARPEKSERGKYIPVVAIVNGRSTRTTLTPAGAGHYRLQFNATLRKATQADVGDVVGVELMIDSESRELPVPPELASRLRKRPQLKKEFDRLPPGGRVQFLRYLERAKSSAVREKCVKRMLEILLERSLLRARPLSPLDEEAVASGQLREFPPGVKYEDTIASLLDECCLLRAGRSFRTRFRSGGKSGRRACPARKRADFLSSARSARESFGQCNDRDIPPGEQGRSATAVGFAQAVFRSGCRMAAKQPEMGGCHRSSAEELLREGNAGDSIRHKLAEGGGSFPSEISGSGDPSSEVA